MGADKIQMSMGRPLFYDANACADPGDSAPAVSPAFTNGFSKASMSIQVVRLGKLLPPFVKLRVGLSGLSGLTEGENILCVIKAQYHSDITECATFVLDLPVKGNPAGQQSASGGGTTGLGCGTTHGCLNESTGPITVECYEPDPSFDPNSIFVGGICDEDFQGIQQGGTVTGLVCQSTYSFYHRPNSALIAVGRVALHP
jgi:hypothetical protein